jgi:hypothetical protein
MMKPGSLKLPPVAGLGATLLLCALLYARGLEGSFLFDDFPNIVDNPDVQVASLNWSDWRAAAWSSPSPELRRPLAMLSFAANYYFTGLAPLPMKLTNLLIHLANGVLLWRVLGVLLPLWNARRAQPLPATTPAWAAVWISAAWLLCPINLSPALYVVQRMESMAQFFVLGGLLLYLAGRRRMLAGHGGGALALFGLAAGTGLGALCKESAALLPLYAFLIEACVLRFEPAVARRRLRAAYALILILPGLLGLVWLLPHALAPGAYADRGFSLAQRLQTECRVLLDYAAWTLFPRPDALGFYHDDLVVSQGWLAPVSTLGSAAAIAGLLVGAALWRRRLPLLSLGIGWYFSAHLLTATVIPLELVFEHRNYFASIGLLLAVTAVVLELPGRLGLLRTTLPWLALAAFSLTTALRANQWSDPIRFAFAEADEHPQSPRANYELGRTLAIASGYRADSKLIDPAMRAFERAAALPGAGTSPDAALIIVANHMHRAVEARWWSRLNERLAQAAMSPDNMQALRSLMECQRQGACAPQKAELLSAYLAALGHGPPGDELLASYGIFAANALADYPLAINMLTTAASMAPARPDYWIELAEVLILQRDDAGAQNALARACALRLRPADRVKVARLRQQIETNTPRRAGSA